MCTMRSLVILAAVWCSAIHAKRVRRQSILDPASSQGLNGLASLANMLASGGGLSGGGGSGNALLNALVGSERGTDEGETGGGGFPRATPPPPKPAVGLNPQFITNLLNGQLSNGGGAASVYDTAPSVSLAENEFVEKCMQWLLGGMLDGLTNQPTPSNPFASVLQSNPRSTNPLGQFYPPPQSSSGGVGNFPFGNIFPGGNFALSTDEILRKFSPEQRQMLQNMRHIDDFKSSTGSTGLLGAVSQKTQPPTGPADEQQRLLRNVQIMRALKQRQPRATPRPVLIITDEGVVGTKPPTRQQRELVDNYSKVVDNHSKIVDRNLNWQTTTPASRTFGYLPSSGDGQLANGEPTSVPAGGATLKPTLHNPSTQLINQLNSLAASRAQQQPPLGTGAADYVSQSANLLAQLLANGPNRQVRLDTGNGRFDRMILHENDALDALGIPVLAGLKSKGLYWGDGNVRVVNERENRLLGQPTSRKDSGFTVPLRPITRSFGLWPSQTHRPCDGGICS